MLDYIDYILVMLIIFVVTVFISIITKNKNGIIDYYLLIVVYIILFIVCYLITYYEYSKATKTIEVFKSNKIIVCVDGGGQQEYKVDSKSWKLQGKDFINNNGLMIKAVDCEELK
jgi:amino acid permease